MFFKDQLLNKIVKNSGIILGGNTAASALGFVSFAIMASSLGPEALALFALAQVYALIVNDLLNVQTWESLIKFGSKSDESQRFSSTVKTNILIDIVSAGLAFAVAISAVSWVGNLLDWQPSLIELALFYSFVIPTTLTTLTIGVPRLYNKFLAIAKIQFVAALLKLALVSYFSYTNADALAFTSVYIGAEVFINLSLITYSLWLLKRKHHKSWYKAPISLKQDEFRFLWWTNLRTIVRIPVRQLDIMIINQVMSLEAVGIYKTYKEVVSIISRLGDPINQALYPEFARLLGNKKQSDSVSVTKNIMGLLLGLSAVVLGGFLLVSETIIGTFFGSEYLTLMTAFYLLVILNCINLFLTPINSLFIAAGFAKYSFYIVLANNILYLIVALLGGLQYGIYGIILAFAAQMIFNQGLKIALLQRHSSGWGEVIR